MGAQTIHPPLQWHYLRCPIVPEAYLSIPLSRVFRLPAAGILFRPQVCFPAQDLEYHKARGRSAQRLWPGVWPLRLLESAASAEREAFPFLSGSMSRLLGTKCLGHVRVYGSGADSTYVFSDHRLVIGAANISVLFLSCTPSWSPGGPRGSEQCHSGSCGRYFFCCAPADQ